MSEFTGKGVLVTGAALGIGRGIAEGFAARGRQRGHRGRQPVAAAETAAAAITALGGGRAIATIGDVASAADAARMVAETVAAFGRLDVLVNNAGIQPAQWYQRIEDLPEEAWDRILGVNLKGVYLMSRFAIPEIRKQGGGAIVNMASVQGLQSMPGVPAYAASKGGVLSLTRNMALDYARDSHPRDRHLPRHDRLRDGAHQRPRGGGDGGRAGGRDDPALRRDASHRAASARPRTSPTRPSSSPRRRRASSPARRSTWTAG